MTSIDQPGNAHPRHKLLPAAATLAVAVALAVHQVQLAGAQVVENRKAVVVSTARELSNALLDPDVWDITLLNDVDFAPELPTWAALPGNKLVTHNMTLHGRPGEQPCIDWGLLQVNGTSVPGLVLGPGVTFTFESLTARFMLNNVPDIIKAADSTATVIVQNVLRYFFVGNNRDLVLQLILNLPDSKWEEQGYAQALKLTRGYCRAMPTRLCWDAGIHVVRDMQDCCGKAPRFYVFNVTYVAEELIKEDCRKEFFEGNSKVCVYNQIYAVRARIPPGQFWPKREASQELYDATMAEFRNDVAAYMQDPTRGRSSADTTRSVGDGSSHFFPMPGVPVIVCVLGGVLLLGAGIAMWACLRHWKQQAEQDCSDHSSDGKGGDGFITPDTTKKLSLADSTSDSADSTTVSDSVAVLVNGTLAVEQMKQLCLNPGGQALLSAGENDNARALPPASGAISLLEMVTPATPMISLNTGLKIGQDVILGPEIGRGAMGVVYRATYKDQAVAVKLIMPGAHASSFITEVGVLGRTQHPNVVRLLGACFTKEEMALVEELQDGSLDQLLFPHGAPEIRLTADATTAAVLKTLTLECATHGSLMPLPLVLHIATEVATGLAYLHPTIIHRDIKPGNVLLKVPPSILDEDGCLPDASILSKNCKDVHVKLSDFGLARVLDSMILVTQMPHRGTLAYMAPECFTKGSSLTHKCDIFSFGVLLWELVHGKRPWHSLTESEIVGALLTSNDRPAITDDESRCPPALRELIESCWQTEADLRPAAMELVRQLSVIHLELARNW